MKKDIKELIDILEILSEFEENKKTKIRLIKIINKFKIKYLICFDLKKNYQNDNKRR